MIQHGGIWIDGKRAIVIELNKDDSNVTVLESGIESRERIPGEKKGFSKFGFQFTNFQKKKENRKHNALQNYLQKVVDAIRHLDEVVIFGPAEMKIMLDKFIHEKSLRRPAIKRVETSDIMTQNEMVALVKKFYKNYT